MPSVKQKRSNLKFKKEKDEMVVEVEQESESKRRPGRDDEPEEVGHDEVVAVKLEPEASQEGVQSDSPSQGEGQTSTQQEGFNFGGDSAGPDRIQIRFPGDTILKRSFPKAFQLTEEVVNGWVRGGQFDSLPIQNPFVRYAAKMGLKKAKEMETKVLESPVTEKVITKVFEAGLKAQSTIEEIRQKLNLSK